MDCPSVSSNSQNHECCARVCLSVSWCVDFSPSKHGNCALAGGTCEKDTNSNWDVCTIDRPTQATTTTTTQTTPVGVSYHCHTSNSGCANWNVWQRSGQWQEQMNCPS